jgi:transposase InsO family protein
MSEVSIIMPMRGSSLLGFLNGLDVTNSFNRPRTSNDNTYIESLFRILKYSSGYPNHFKCIDDSRAWMADFIIGTTTITCIQL